MSALHVLIKQMAKLGLVLMLGASMSACSTSWKEEVQLHDGNKIVVKRSQSRGGGHEPGNRPPINQEKITFTVPKNNKTLSFTSEYSEDIDKMNFDLLALHILDETPYLIVAPYLCLSYNKWGRPNPPYVIFKHEESNWKRIPLQELPTEFKEINLMVGGYDPYRLSVAERDASVLGAEVVKKLNRELTQSVFHSILREPIKAGIGSGASCGEMVYDGNGGWIGIGWFRNKPSYEACLSYCNQERMTSQYCPCATLFKGVK